MAHFVRIIKAARLKKQLEAYFQQKEIGCSRGESDDNEFLDSDSSEYEGWCDRQVKKIKTKTSKQNFIWTSFMGFVGGVLLGYLFFFLFYIAVHFSLRATTYISAVVGVILCLGLAFSSNIRCYVLLLISVFFSTQGRQALLAYALFLAFTGPASNTMHNMGVLSDSMSCGQEMDKRTLKDITEMSKTPYRSLREILEQLRKAIKRANGPFIAFFNILKTLINNILTVIVKSTEWLGSIVNVCNKKVGTPFQRCMKAFDQSTADCKAKLGKLSYLCNVGHLAKATCYTVKSHDYFCTFTDLVSDKIVGVLKKKLTEFGYRIGNTLYVSVEFSHTCQFETKASENSRRASETIFKKLVHKIEKLQTLFSFFGFIFSLLFLLLIVNVYYYRYKFLCSDKYDNVYISEYIVELDIKRALMDRETVLPLEPREKKSYTRPTAFRLVALEKSRMTESIFFLSLTAFKVLTFLVFDYSLFWMLLTVYKEERDAIMEVEKPKVELHVQGTGVLADFYENLGGKLRVPENLNMSQTALHCHPDPSPPDTGRYIQIGFLVVLCMVLTIAEPYGLRLRNAVMSHYYPDRARERAIWLYNHILRSRGSFLRYARRQLRRKFTNLQLVSEEVSVAQRLFVNVPLIGLLFGGEKKSKCLFCGGTEKKVQHLKWCKTSDCQGRYCEKCFSSLECICTICQHPLEYGDVSDISEELDSSDEDCPKRKSNVNCWNDSDSEKHLTFKDMEVRGRFRDVESNRLTDYAKLGDLYQDKKALKRRLKTVLRKHIENVKSEKQKKVRIKQSMYKLIGLKIKRMLANIQRKKLREVLERKSQLRKKFAEKIHILKRCKRIKQTECLLEVPEQCSTSRAFLKPEPEVPEVKQFRYKLLKQKLKTKIEALKEKERLRASTSNLSPRETCKLQDSRKSSKKSLSECEASCSKENDGIYYFVENEKVRPFSRSVGNCSDEEPGFFWEPESEV